MLTASLKRLCLKALVCTNASSSPGKHSFYNIAPQRYGGPTLLLFLTAFAERAMARITHGKNQSRTCSCTAAPTVLKQFSWKKKEQSMLVTGLACCVGGSTREGRSPNSSTGERA